MDTKPLYIMVWNGGDGSYSTVFTLDPVWIQCQEDRYRAGEVDCEDIGVDGDGFHYSVVRVPADSTYESLGISRHRTVDSE